MLAVSDQTGQPTTAAFSAYHEHKQSIFVTKSKTAEACHAACDAGIGGVRAMQLIQKHGSLEAVMSQLDTARYGVPDPFPFSEARVLFKGE